METMRAVKPDEISYELIALRPIREPRWKGFRTIRWRRTSTRAKICALAALLTLVFSFGLAVLKHRDFSFSVPSFERFFSRAPSNESAVLAVDSLQLAIHGRNVSAAARERLEQAVVQQVARLHPIYAGWATTDENALGSLLLRLHVDGAGKVVRIEPLRSHLPSADFSRAVLDEIRHWQFADGPAQPVEIVVPLHFVPKGLDANTVVQWERLVRETPLERKIISPVQGVPTVTAPPAITPTASATRSEAPLETLNVTKTKSPEPALSVVKTTRPLALRQRPRFAAERIREIDADTELSLLERKGNWLKVKLTDAAVVGFVRKEYLTPPH